MLLATLLRVSVLTFKKEESWKFCLVHQVNAGCFCNNFLLNNLTKVSGGDRYCSAITPSYASIDSRAVLKLPQKWFQVK
jgi:hypothetical protein